MKTKSTLVIVVVALVLIIAAWYLSSRYIKQFQEGNVEDGYMSDNIDTTESISSDMNQIPEDSSVDGDMNALDKDLQGF